MADTKISKWKAFKIIFFFTMSLIIITGTLSAVIRTYFDTGFRYIYLLPLLLVLLNFAYIWSGRSQRNSFIFSIITAVTTGIILRII